jgi:hypothetical protein
MTVIRKQSFARCRCRRRSRFQFKAVAAAGGRSIRHVRPRDAKIADTSARISLLTQLPAIRILVLPNDHWYHTITYKKMTHLQCVAMMDDGSLAIIHHVNSKACTTVCLYFFSTLGV